MFFANRFLPQPVEALQNWTIDERIYACQIR
jgi:hypothetical protein